MTIQVQLAHTFKGKMFEHGLYSRKFDGKRMYIMDGVGYSRTNKECRPAPIKHIINEIVDSDLNDYGLVTDGEILYFEPGFKEDFKQTVSLTSRIERAPECDNLYYVIFDAINSFSFCNGIVNNVSRFSHEYMYLCELLDAEPIPGRTDLLKTKFPHILIARQTENMEELTSDPNYQNWEGLMYRNADAPYEFKRSQNILKIKKWYDIELPVIDFQEGLGKHEGRLGALLVNYKDNIVSVGSGFNDQEREIIWDKLTDSTSSLYKAMSEGNLYIKVKYFEESTNADGGVSLRFPIYQCFRDKNLDEYLIN